MARATGRTEATRTLRPLASAALALTALVTLLACSAGPPAPTATSQPAPTPTLPAAPGDPADSFPGFDYERVRLMGTAELPAGVPVPVPGGGLIDDTVRLLDGELLVVEYDNPRFFNTAFAFYSVWIGREGLAAEELIAMGSDATGWRVTIDGEPVQIRLSRGENTRLEVRWD